MFIHILFLYICNKLENYLIFGCRNCEKDYYYKEEWKQYVDNNQLKKLFVAFSRDQVTNLFRFIHPTEIQICTCYYYINETIICYKDKKVYVQDIIKENSQLFWNVIHEHEGYIYLSG